MLTQEQFETLLKNDNSELLTFIKEAELNITIDDTKAIANFHFLSVTQNGQVRFKDFAQFLATKVIDFAIPRSEIEEAKAHLDQTGSTSKLVQLNKKASNLFTKLEKSGEGGEILLYMIIEHILKVPQLMCKMAHKTSPEMHVHGCDGIHAKYDAQDDILSIYWGESKLHESISSAVDECFDSMKKFLMDDGGSSSTQERDFQLMRNFIDLNDENLENAIVNYLDKNNPKFNQVKYAGVCLVGFDFSHYPSIENSNINEEQIKQKITEVITRWKPLIKERISSAIGLERFEIHFFFLPFPSVADFRKAFFNELGITRT